MHISVCDVYRTVLGTMLALVTHLSGHCEVFTGKVRWIATSSHEVVRRNVGKNTDETERP